MPFDAAVRTATLPNGLTYFIRQNARPAKRVSLRLAVKAGSLFEADDQQGLAHLIEHMAFNGSAHFKPGELVSYFESIGARLGPHVNAYTSFDETVYMLDLPTDKPEVVDKGLTALADFAGGLTLDRRRKSTRSAASSSRSGAAASAPARASATSSSRCSSTSRATPSGCRSASPTSSATRRSRGCARSTTPGTAPSGMAVIVVGDVEPAADRAGDQDRVRAADATRAPAAPLPDRTVPLHQQPLVSVVADPEVTQSTVQIVRKRPREGEQKVGDYRRDLVARTIEHMMDERFGELARKPDAKFLGAGVGGGGLSRTSSTFTMARAACRTASSRTASACSRSRRSASREFGFSGIGARSRQAVDGGVLRARLQRARQDRERLVRAGVRQLLPQRRAEPRHRLRVPARAAAAAGHHRWPTSSTLARSLLGDDSRVILAASPQKAGIKIPTEAELQAALAAADAPPRHAVDRHERDARADGARAGSRRGRLAPRRSTTSASPSSASPTASKRG